MSDEINQYDYGDIGTTEGIIEKEYQRDQNLYRKKKKDPIVKVVKLRNNSSL